jgi:hypothetical protein
VAHHLDIELDMAAIQKMIDSFTETGFMAGSK